MKNMYADQNKVYHTLIAMYALPHNAPLLSQLTKPSQSLSTRAFMHMVCWQSNKHILTPAGIPLFRYSTIHTPTLD